MKNGWKILRPGLAVDENGALHFSVPEILDAAGVPNTPANQEIVFNELRRELRKQFPDLKITEVD